MKIFCEIRVIPQFFDVLEIKFQTEFKWDTNERGGMLQRMKIFIGSPFGGNDDDHRQWRMKGGVVGAAASRMQVQGFARSRRWEPQPGCWRAERD